MPAQVLCDWLQQGLPVYLNQHHPDLLQHIPWMRKYLALRAFDVALDQCHRSPDGASCQLIGGYRSDTRPFFMRFFAQMMGSRLPYRQDRVTTSGCDRHLEE